MPFAAGDRVHLPGLGTGTIREVRSGRRYAIELKGRVVIAREADLEAADQPRSSRRGQKLESVVRDEDHVARAGAPASLDLHGKTVEEAVDALDAFISDALLAGHPEIRVVHGISGGKLKAAVHQRLRLLPSIQSFRIDPRNAGVTIVSLT